MSTMKRWEWVFIATILLASGIFMSQCGDTESASGDPVAGQSCVAHEDCPVEYACGEDDEGNKVCQYDPEGSTSCNRSSDCTDGYDCYQMPNGEYKCMPVPDGDDPIEDGDENAEQEVDNTLPNECDTSADCGFGEHCDLATHTCVDDEPTVDGDEPEDVDDPIEDGDDTPIEDGDTDPDPTDTDPEQTGQPCIRSADCAGGKICGPGGVCKESCTETGCTFGVCNPNNGLCEYCDDPICPTGKCCNYNEDFWYCGTCCSPPCANGEACQAGTCIPLECPSCPPNYHCSADTDYICVQDVVGPDGDTGERGGFTCLEANAPCIEGVDICCSGTCLMGTCL